MKIKIFADGADLNSIKKHTSNPLIKGFTTNPTLMKKAGITDYTAFAKEALQIIGNMPISFEVFADEEASMYTQAMKIASWGPNVYVKIPVMFTNGRPTSDVIARLADQGVQMNVTAIMTINQVITVSDVLGHAGPSVISVFAGRIGDAGGDVFETMRWSGTFLKNTRQELLWASPRQVYDVILAEKAGAKIITVTDDLLKKIPTFGKDLYQFSNETVKMFYDDAKSSGFSL